jgi:hypothetical protein
VSRSKRPSLEPLKVACLKSPPLKEAAGYRLQGMSWWEVTPMPANGASPCTPESVKKFKTGWNGGGRGSRRASLVDKFRESRLARRLALPIFSHLPFKGGMPHKLTRIDDA